MIITAGRVLIIGEMTAPIGADSARTITSRSAVLIVRERGGRFVRFFFPDDHVEAPRGDRPADLRPQARCGAGRRPAGAAVA